MLFPAVNHMGASDAEVPADLCLHQRIIRWAGAELQPLWAPMMEDVLSALDMSSSSQHEWEGQQFAELAILILEAEHNAVPVAKAVSCLGVRGRATLEALIRANLIAYRPNSGILSASRLA